MDSVLLIVGTDRADNNPPPPHHIEPKRAISQSLFIFNGLAHRPEGASSLKNPYVELIG